MNTITLCASVSFYQQVVEIKKQLEQEGWHVLVPDLALMMEKQNDYNFMSYAEKFDSTDPLRKQKLITSHFDKIAQSDAVLIVNLEKHGREGYIGANVLMEMTIGFYLKKQLYLWQSIPTELFCYDEVMALQPSVLHGNIHYCF